MSDKIFGRSIFTLEQVNFYKNIKEGMKEMGTTITGIEKSELEMIKQEIIILKEQLKTAESFIHYMGPTKFGEYMKIKENK